MFAMWMTFHGPPHPHAAVLSCSLICCVQAHCPIKPVLVFVSSRRQTRLTALDLLGFAAADERPRQFVHCPEEELDQAVATIKVLYLVKLANALGCIHLQNTAPGFHDGKGIRYAQHFA